MKIRLSAFLIALLLLLPALPAAAQDALPDAVRALCDRAYPAHIIARWDGWGDDAQGQFALVLHAEQDNILCIAEKAEGEAAYRFTVENTHAVQDGDTLPSVFIDNLDALYYAYTDGNVKTEYVSMKKNGEWQAVGTVRRDVSHAAYDLETTMSVRGGALCYERQRYDKNENPMDSSDLAQPMEIPVSTAFAKGMKLAAFDIGSVSTTGYEIPAVPGLCDGLLAAGDTLVQVNAQEDAIIMLVRKADGMLRLRLTDGWDEYKNGYAVIETGDLPQNAHMDTFHASAARTLHLKYGDDIFNFGRGYDGKWRLSSVQARDDFAVHYDGISDWESGGYLRNDGVVYGASPWHADITRLDMNALPTTIKEAVAKLDRSAYAVVNNPNPQDRLHLREQPKKGAASLGKFYNRTPVQVLGMDGEWTHVRIGSEAEGIEGWMMSEYLAFGGSVSRVECAFPQMFYRENEFAVYILDAPGNAKTRRYMEEWPGAYIIGVVGDEWYVVMTKDGCVGYMKQSLFEAGNG